MRLDGWQCDHEDCGKSCHAYCYYLDRKEKLPRALSDSTVQQVFVADEVLVARPAFKYWYRKPRAAECDIETDRWRSDISQEDVSDSEPLNTSISTLKQIDVTEKIIYEKIREMAVPAKPSTVVGLCTTQETFCDSHSALLSSYCNCRENKEKIDPEEIQSIFCEDCGLWFHKPCVRSADPGGQPRSGSCYELEVSEMH
jgi:hypothetical protein